jgi:NAD(P)-dependent dehydrogenase (short-subunit alcohol dehydrogenase family)
MEAHMTAKSLRVLVTGASSGIGRAVAAEFAKRGHTVYAAARRREALADLAATTPRIHPVVLDVTDLESIRSGWAAIETHSGGHGVDILVNNAGFSLRGGPVELLDPADLRRQFDTNVFGLVAITQAALPAMRARRAGRIVNISSLLGRMTLPGAGAYAATKHAVESLSDALRQEIGEYGIDVVVIEPGFVSTNLAHAADARPSAPTSGGGAYATLRQRTDEYLTTQLAAAPPPETMAVSIVREALRRRARTRRVMWARNRALLALLTTMPDRWADAARRRVLRLNAAG